MARKIAKKKEEGKEKNILGANFKLLRFEMAEVSKGMKRFFSL